MRTRKTTERPDEQVQTKLIGVTVPLPLHREFRQAAEREKTTATGLLRKLIIQHLDEAQTCHEQ